MANPSRERKKSFKKREKREREAGLRVPGGSDSNAESCLDISLRSYRDLRANMQTIRPVCFQSHGPEVPESQRVCSGIS